MYSPICIYLSLPNAILKTSAWTYWYSKQRHRRDGGGEVSHRHMATDLIAARLCGWTSRGCDLIGADDLIGTGLCDWTSSGCDLIGAGLCGWISRGCDLIGADDRISTGLCGWTFSRCDLIGADDLIGAELWTPNTQCCFIIGCENLCNLTRRQARISSNRNYMRINIGAIY
jgi:uncharacterized protein YjbI with pentapeptide repeats